VRRTTILALGLLATLLALPAAAESFEVAVSYEGSGAWRTAFHARPPNPGGRADTNDVADASTQRWALRFARPLRLDPCTGSPCQSSDQVRGATGRSTVTGRIDHRHVDGLYPRLDAKVKCRLRRSTRAPATASVDAGLSADGSAMIVRVGDPVVDAAVNLPGACPQQGDSLDLILDNYFGPAFSFDEDFGAERWLTARPVSVPVARLRAGARVQVRLGPSRAAVPPRDCAVLHPSFERCTTGGSWSGTLTLAVKP
jgi:hypothetical protein